MDTTYIEKQINILDKGIEWGKSYISDPGESQEFHRRLVNIRREMSKIKDALSERCAAATYGESQMGKSYLVNAMFSEPSMSFCIKNGEDSYDFKKEINPSEPNSQIEATGVVTRFTHKAIDLPRGVPSSYLRAQLLSIADLVMIVCESYYNGVDYKFSSKQWVEKVKVQIEKTPLNHSQKILSESDVLTIEEYLKTSPLDKKCSTILEDEVGYFQFLFKNVTNFSEEDLIDYIKLLWDNNEEISTLFDKLIECYRKLHFSPIVYVEFDAILKKYGTLIDVARLKEMFQKPKSSSQRITAKVQLQGQDSAIEVEKSFLSALIAELTLYIDFQDTKTPREFLNHLDILDFPGACPDPLLSLQQLQDPEQLAYVYRRGKVSYLFKKYSTTRKISTLLFCHNNHQQKFELMGKQLTQWIEENIGENALMREEYLQNVGNISPFFIISTWFNTDLAYGDQKPGDKLDYLWARRFNEVLSTGVLKVGNGEHWFTHWTSKQTYFQNIYLLRDFGHSTMIYKGYNAQTHSAETDEIQKDNYVNYPDLLSDLKRSFVENEFVRKHFSKPTQAWEESALPQNDGTLPIMRALDAMAPKIANAREIFLAKKVDAYSKSMLTVLENLYESGDASESIKKAKRAAGRINLSIDSQCGQDPYFFGRMMDCITIPEATFYEMVFAQLDGHQQSLPMTDRESQIYMNAKLDSGLTRAQNVERLCDYLGLDNEQECAEVLKEQGVDVESLLNKTQMLVNSAEQLVNYIEGYWYNTFLMGTRVNILKERLPMIGDVFQNMYALYKALKVHQMIVQRVDKYIKELKEDVQPRIIADYLAMEYNHFMMCYGYDYIQPEALKKLEEQSAENNLNIDWDLLHHEKAPSGIALLENMAATMDKLAGMSYGAEVHALQLSLPEYKSRWQWQQQMRVAMLMVCNIPNPKYGVLANDKLGEIIKNVKS